MDDLVSPLRAVCVLDPALDRLAMDVARYAETRDPALVRELPGRRARWVILDPLSVGDFVIADGYPATSMKVRAAFRYAVREIHAFDGSERLHPKRLVVGEDGRERAVWTDEELDRIFHVLGAAFLYEIGSLAYERAVSGNFWGGSVPYTLPPSSAQGLTLIARLLAAQSQASAGTPSSAASASRSTPRSGASSDVDTAAPAASGPESQGVAPSAT